MADLGALTSIKELDIRNSNVSAEGYAELVRLRLLAGLDLSGATCDDASLAQISRIASLRRLGVHSSPVQVSLGRVTRCLRRVDIAMCSEFDDDGLAELLRLKSVKWVNIVETGVKTRPNRATIKR